MTDPVPADRLVVGFDLDQTLIDTVPAIAASLAAAAAEIGVRLDIPALLRGLGPDIRDLLGTQVPAGTAERIAARYREIYTGEGLSQVARLPGAREALAAVVDHGGSVVVVTGQREDSSRRHLAFQSLPFDRLVGSTAGMAKTAALVAHGVAVYVGDQPLDVRAAQAAGAVAVAVATGQYGAAELSDADVLLESLQEFPGWLRRHMAQGGPAGASGQPVEIIG